MNFNIREQITKSDADIEKALRPLVFADFNGQGKIVENLSVFVEAAKMRAESLDHCCTVLRGWARPHCRQS